MQSSFTPPPPLEERKPSATVPASPYSVPPGLVGEIAQFTYAQAPRPVAEIALAAGIALVSGIVGRAFNVFGNGTNVYILLLAPTGTGKEAPSTAIAKLMQAASAHTLAGQIGQTKLAEGGLPLAKGFIGASDFSSAPALHRKLAKQISFLSIINEFGELLGLLFDKPNMNMRTLRKMIVQLYEKSKRGNTLGAAAYADIEKDIAAVDAKPRTADGCNPRSLVQRCMRNPCSRQLREAESISNRKVRRLPHDRRRSCRNRRSVAAALRSGLARVERHACYGPRPSVSAPRLH